MGRRRKGAPPAYLFHKGTGQGYSILDGRHVYHGEHDSPKSRRKYTEFIRRWEQTQTPAPIRPGYNCTVLEMVAAFLDHAKAHYRRADGELTSEYAHYKDCLEDLLNRYADLGVNEFGAKDLKALREGWIEAGNARLTVNAKVGRIRRIFRWSVGEEMVDPAVVIVLEAVKDLQEGRTPARETAPVPPAALDAVEATLPFVSRQATAMARLQLAVGMRPGEVCRMRGVEINRDGIATIKTSRGQRSVRITTGGWVFQPEQHKNRSKGKGLVYVLGPQARDLLAPWLRDDPEEYLFQPCEAEAERKALQRERRKSRVQPSQVDRSKRNAVRKPRNHYTSDTYCSAIIKGTRKANRARAKQGLPPVEHWSPGQLRHNYLTRVESTEGFDLLDASLAVGHASPTTTELYVLRDLRRAAEVAEQLG
jgi:integrase